MPRAIRCNAPGHGHHITARTSQGIAWFVPELRDKVAEMICEAAAPCGTKVLALVVMSNHFHMVIRQGTYPLGWMMQRAMQRIAHLMQKEHDVEGHVFGRRYWSSVCAGPDYLRQAIIYTHLNPTEAQLCEEPHQYRWSSHNAFGATQALPPWAEQLAAREAKLLFANDSLHDDDVANNYMRILRYWAERRRDRVPGERYLFEPPDREAHPSARLGDKYWAQTYSHSAVAERVSLVQTDVRDRAIMVLRGLNREVDIDMLRHMGNTRALRELRRNVIAALIGYGYRHAAIARCLRVSPSVVSDVARTLIRPHQVA